MPQIGDIVAVMWRDAHATVTGEVSEEEIREGGSYPWVTYGLLVRDDRLEAEENDRVVKIAGEKSPEDGRYRTVTTVPVEMIIEITLIKRMTPRPRKKKEPVVE